VWLDNLIGYFSPNAGLNRMKSRKAMEAVRHYEGASRSKRTQNWKADSTSVNNENQSIEILRNRARDLCRNNPFAAKAKSVISSNIVGNGIKPHLSEGRFAELWKEWSETTACDYDGQLTLAGIQKLVTESTVESGEVFVKRVLVPNDPIFPLKLQILESDFCPVDRVATPRANSGNRIVQGLELNKKNKIVAYHMYETHPGGVSEELLNSTFVTKRIAANDIAHIFRNDRPGQYRGVTWFHPVMILLKELDEYTDAQLVRQKIASMFAGFIKDFEAVDGNDDPENDPFCNLSAGSIDTLPPGKDIMFTNPPGVQDSYRDYVSTILHAIAAGLQISYESLTGDLSQVNFSSARMGWLEMHRTLESWRATVFNNKLNDKVFKWFADVALAQGIRNDVNVFNPIWTSPKREMIDPTKEIPAKIKAIRAGLVSPSDAIRELGKHPDDHYREVSEDFKKLDELGLFLDSDPRKTGINGKAQDSGSEESETNEES